MKTTLAYGIAFTLAAWIPGGLIHQGQRTVNPRAESIVGSQLLSRAATPLRLSGGGANEP